jgi:hypothetical protein
MFPMKIIRIRSYEMGLCFHDGEFRGLLAEGTHRRFDPLNKTQVDIVSRRDPWLQHEKLDVIVKSGELKDHAIVVDLKDHDRGLVSIEGRFSHVLPPGLYAYWTGLKDVEVIDPRSVRFEHSDLRVITRSPMVGQVLDICTVNRQCMGVLSIDGRYIDTLDSGLYAFWKGTGDAKVVEIDLRETMTDVSGQEIMTSDKISLRMNAVVTYRIVDARKAVTATDDVRQTLYREVQLALRAVVGAHELDSFLTDKDAVASEIEEMAPRRRVGPGTGVGRNPGCDSAWRHEGPDEQGHGGEKGRRGQPHLTSRRDGSNAESGQHGKGTGRQPDSDAAPGTGSPGEDRHDRRTEDRTWQKGTGRPRRESAVSRNAPGLSDRIRGVFFSRLRRQIAHRRRTICPSWR